MCISMPKLIEQFLRFWGHRYQNRPLNDLCQLSSPAEEVQDIKKAFKLLLVLHLLASWVSKWKSLIYTETKVFATSPLHVFSELVL